MTTGGRRSVTVRTAVTVSLLGALVGCAAEIDPQPAAPSPAVSTAPASPAPSSTAASSTGSPATPTTTPSASSRTLGEANLLTVRDIPSPAASIEVEEVEAGRGRRPDQVSICFPAGTGDLGATTTRSRNFRFVLSGLEEEAGEPGAPDPKDPSIYTVGLQFADTAAAERALKTYQGWVADCRSTLAKSKQWNPIRAAQNSSAFRPVKLSGAGQGAWAEVPLYRAKSDTSDSGIFETVGLTLVTDRLMVTVDLVYGMDKITSTKQGGDPDSGVPADRQFDLVDAAATHLAR